MRFSIVSTALAGAILCGLAVYVSASEMAVPSASRTIVGGPTSIPYGWIDFCSRRPQECTGRRLPARDIALTGDSWKLLQRVNRQVNHEIQPLSNLEHWGTILDHWDYPVDGKGDCKIYALWKRKLLIDEGWPRQALLTGQAHPCIAVTPRRTALADVWFLTDGRDAVCLRLAGTGELTLLRWRRRTRQWRRC